ncbi:MAG TPA: 1-deoxy-D-xylulose-5-phosphate synthase [Streptosporangiaceae bacterium]|nr:1-deoxy-D-xylulose-5-phosphate synthase [Streptosporangiaceae bacterium]
MTADKATLLHSIGSPDDVKALSQEDLPLLAQEIRTFLIEAVSRNGGHLGPNLGVVELTIALHRVFDSPSDHIVWDTGHQSYVHKLLTGRLAGFGRLRQSGGVSGYPNRSESEHDLVENSHASTSLSYADGLAKAIALRGETHRHVVAVIGDGALTGGMAWEALNNIAGARDRPVVVVVNDNGRSYQRTIGGLADHLATVRVSQRYEQVLDLVKTTLSHTPLVGPPLFETLHGIKKGLKDVLQPQVLFEDLGLKYLGPIDGHDEQALEHALGRAREFGSPVLVHVITQKGRGYPLAEENDEDCLHQVPPGAPVQIERPSANGASANGSAPKAAAPARRGWTQVFADEIVDIGARRPDIVAITAAMLHPTGLAKFGAAYPDRVFDVGIAEQHAVTSAAGLAMGGMHPVVAIYATFLNRAFDQVLMDVAMHRLPVTFVLDRAGVTGPDGASHHGMWDGSLLQIVPGMRVAVPRDGARLTELLREAVSVADGPTAIRFPRGTVPDDLPSVGSMGGMDVLARPAEGTGSDVLLVAAGPMAGLAVEAAGRLAGQGIGVTVVDPRWVKPLDPALAQAAAAYKLVATVEDNGVVGGFGDAVARLLRETGTATPLRTFGLPQRFLSHGERGEVLAGAGLTPQHLAREITGAVAGLTPDLVPDGQD